MKRSTLLLLLLAALGGALIYYLEIKPGKPRDEEKTEKAQPAFSITREEITGITLTRGAETTRVEQQNGKWMIAQPVTAPADESALNTLVGDVVSANIERELSPSGDDLKSYGLTTPAVKLELKLKDGKTRTVELGGKDVTGSSAYARIDGSQKVALVPASLLSSADKSLSDLRDRSLFDSTYELTGLKVNNESGGFALAKQDVVWKLKSPVEADADEGVVSSLVSELTGTKAAEIVSETVDDAAKYGFDKSKLSATTKRADGGERTVSVGAKVDDKYYARLSDRPQVFKVDQAFYDKLNTKAASLRSKEMLTLKSQDLKSLQIKNPNGTLTAEDKDGKLIATAPTEQKDKEVQPSKVLTPFQASASEVIDKPSAAVLAKLAKPAVEARFTDKTGKATVIKVSAADGDDCYVRVEGRPGVYKASKALVEGLSFKLAEAVQ